MEDIPSLLSIKSSKIINNNDFRIRKRSSSFILKSENNEGKIFLNINQFDKIINNKDFQTLIIDTRFIYEFKGGSISNSINISNPEVIKILFKKYYQLLNYKCFIAYLKHYKTIECINSLNDIISKYNKPKFKNNCKLIIILFCEFSVKRSLKIYDLIRNIDRNNNIDNYPYLNFKNMYLLKGGYLEYSKIYKTNYISMFDKSYENEYNDCMHNFNKNWNIVNNKHSILPELKLLKNWNLKVLLLKNN